MIIPAHRPNMAARLRTCPRPWRLVLTWATLSSRLRMRHEVYARTWISVHAQFVQVLTCTHSFVCALSRGCECEARVRVCTCRWGVIVFLGPRFPPALLVGTQLSRLSGEEKWSCQLGLDLLLASNYGRHREGSFNGRSNDRLTGSPGFGWLSH